MIYQFKKFISSKWIQHFGFWVLSLYAIGSYFSISNELKIIDFIYSAFFHIPLMILVYINLRLHIPKFLQQERYVLYLLMSGFNLAAAYFIHQLVFDLMIPVLPTDFYMVSFTEASVLISIFFLYLGITTLLKLSKSWYELQEVEKERLSLELNSLKMQINPHFLFNSLNSIYSLARKKSDKAPAAILQLSDLMRYIIYEVAEEDAYLEKEIEAMKDYIELQTLRLEPGTNIKFSTEVKDPNQKVAPLLFFPLIENSFKHGLKGDLATNFVHIDLKSDQNSLTFTIANNKGEIDDMEKGIFGGIGLVNVKKRLHLIYKDRANLNIQDKEDTFSITLTIQWHD